MFKYRYNQPLSSELFLSRPNHHIIGPLECQSARLHLYLRDITELSIRVYKKQNGVINKLYDLLNPFMEIYIPDIGWFRINGQPNEYIDYSSDSVYKQVTAYGYETQLQDVVMSTLYINAGVPLSMEMFEENLNALGIPIRNITFYIDNANEDPKSENYYGLGLLNIIEHDFLNSKGWTIGKVDTGLKSLRGRKFEIESQDVYSFLTQDVARSYKCIFEFDTINKKISAIPVESLNKCLNIEASKSNFLNKATIMPQNEVIFNRLFVSGGNSNTLISYSNFGWNDVINLNYSMEVKQLNKVCIKKYQEYTQYRDSRRSEYSQTIKDYLSIQQKIDVIHQQVPIDECSINWNSYKTEDLQTNLDLFKSMVETLEKAHTVEGVLQIEETPDYAAYRSIKDTIVPKIEEVLTAKEEGRDPEIPDYKINWELYGIDELQIQRDSYENICSVWSKMHYDEPWSSDLGTVEVTHKRYHEQFLKYKQYIQEIDKRLDILKASISEYEKQIESILFKRNEISDSVKLENPTFGFTEQELSDIYSIYSENQFEDTSIEVQDMDDIDAIIELSEELYQSGLDELEKVCRPQTKYSIEVDNIFLIDRYQRKANLIEMGDLMFLDLDGGRKEKQRIIEMELELVDFSDTSLVIVFSDMVNCRGAASDYEFLLGSNANKRTGTSTGGDSPSSIALMNNVAMEVLQNYLNGGSSLFPSGGVSASDQQTLLDALNGLIDGHMSVDEFKTNLANIKELNADSAFINYLNSQYIVGKQADFVDLKAKLGFIDDLLTGTVSSELGHIINLTAENVNIDEAVIKKLIAAQIMVSDLKAGDITLNGQMRILSENRLMVMNGETLQIKGTSSTGEEYVAIQLGYDSQNKPSLIIRDETGAVMLDAQGLHENIVPDGFIKNDMIADNAVGKGKIDWTDISKGVDEDGNPTWDMSQVTIENQKADIVFKQFKEDVVKLSDMAKSISLTGQQFFTEVGNTITPSKITVTATVKNGVTIDKWFLDGVENTSYVSVDKLSINILSSYMVNKKSVVIKAQNSTGTIFDIFTLHKIADGISGEDAYTVIMSNESQTISTDINYIPLNPQTFKSELKVFRGTKELTPVSGTPTDGKFSITLPSNPAGLTLAQATLGTVSFTPTTQVAIQPDGVIDLTINIGGLSSPIKKSINYSASVEGKKGDTGTGYTVILSNEAHTFPGSTSAAIASSASTNVIAFKNTTQTAATISKIGTASVSGNASGISTGITGLTAAVTNNGTTTATIIFSATTALVSKTGTIPITLTVDGKTFTKNFSFSLALTGNTGATGSAGANAKAVDITASSQVFKSTDGGLTFSPDTITLTPTFQGGITFSKWQYSINGGSTWVDVLSGSNGLTIANGALTIAKGSPLFTSTITAISFKVLSNNASYFDIMTVLKLYDVTDLQIGGRNLAQNTSSEFSKPFTSFTGTTNTCPTLGKALTDGLQVGDTVTLRLVYEYTDIVAAEGNTASCWIQGSGNVTYWDAGAFSGSPKLTLSGNGEHIFLYSFVITENHLQNSHWALNIRHDYVASGSVRWKLLKVERGNKATDWSPAPEDMEKELASVTDSISDMSVALNNVTKEMSAKIGQEEFVDVINGIHNDVDSITGQGKWLVEIYNKDSLPEENRDLTTIEALWGTGIFPIYVVELDDKNTSVNLSFGKDYIGYAKTFAYFDEAFTWKTTLLTNGNGFLIVNARQIELQTKANVPLDVTIDFKSGWNPIEVLWNTDGGLGAQIINKVLSISNSAFSTSGNTLVINDTANAEVLNEMLTSYGDNGFQFGSFITSIPECRSINCNKKHMTSREKRIVDRSVEITIGLDGIKKDISRVETDVITKADGSTVEILSEKINETIETFSKFQRTITDNYITNEEMNAMKSELAQTAEAIGAVVTKNEIESMIELSAEALEVRFSEGETKCGIITFNPNGITVGGPQNNEYRTQMNAEGFFGWGSSTAEKPIFSLTKEETYAERLRIEKGADLTTIKLVPVIQNGFKGLDYLNSSATLYG